MDADAVTPPLPSQPTEYRCRILLAVCGLTPQIVTETLYALAAYPGAPFVPTEIHLITSAEGSRRAELSLLSDDLGWFHRLCEDYHLPGITFDRRHIHVMRNASGEPMDDIRTPQDNQAAADFITDKVRLFTSDPNCALHASIAGGRKTMGFYLGYALSLYGRSQDRLSHVLVSEPFESSWDFFYPTPYSRVITTRDNKLADTVDAQVTLAEIPLVRLRDELPHRFLRESASLTEIVAAANRALKPPELLLEVGAQRTWMDGQPVALSPTEFAMLLWLARHTQSGKEGIDWSSQQAAHDFLATAKQVMNPMGGDYGRIENALSWREDKPIKLGKYFEPHKSRINAAIEDVLGKSASRRYLIARNREDGIARYFLPLNAEQVVIRN